jgi:hypothetical protein
VPYLSPWLPKLKLLAAALGSLRWTWARQALQWISAHTGAPAILVAAVLVVVLYRLAKKSLRFVAQVSLVLALLALLAHYGLLRF